ncbi:hypothetical protein ECANGB1_1112 [Enterospora canceri]|uniref:Uncharacterized protein n=1 Tax=Enterospora canceri TaxID=1081671 RepID=A0A1Y1S6S5_9MICR|nr:hypothetical protein ECANGB1_1112 [Enterospora canceri]
MADETENKGTSNTSEKKSLIAKILVAVVVILLIIGGAVLIKKNSGLNSVPSKNAARAKANASGPKKVQAEALEQKKVPTTKSGFKKTADNEMNLKGKKMAELAHSDE